MVVVIEIAFEELQSMRAASNVCLPSFPKRAGEMLHADDHFCTAEGKSGPHGKAHVQQPQGSISRITFV